MKNKYLRSFKFLDQIVSAVNTYLVLFPFILLTDFDSIAELSLLLSFFAFWQSLIRSSLVIGIFNPENAKISLNVFRKKAFKVSILSVPILGFSFQAHFSFDRLFILIVTIFIGMQQEVFRQFCINKKEYFIALASDASWLMITTSTLVILQFNNILTIETALLSWMFGGIFCIAVGIFRKKNSDEDQTSIKVVLPRPISLFITSIAAVLPIIQNYFLIKSGLSTELGVYRSIQLVFLPAIFLINLQQPYLSESMFNLNYINIKNVKVKMYYGLSFLVLLCLGASLLTDLPHGYYNFVYLILSVSIFLAFEISFVSLYLLISKFEVTLVKLRLIWLGSSITVMLLFTESIYSFLLVQFLMDFALYFFALKKLTSYLKNGNV